MLSTHLWGSLPTLTALILNLREMLFWTLNRAIRNLPFRRLNVASARNLAAFELPMNSYTSLGCWVFGATFARGVDAPTWRPLRLSAAHFPEAEKGKNKRKIKFQHSHEQFPKEDTDVTSHETWRPLKSRGFFYAFMYRVCSLNNSGLAYPWCKQ